jgi:hypothetical protein
MSWRAHFGRLCGYESNHVSRRHYESLCLRGKFHRGDRIVKRYLPRDRARASIPPPHQAESGPSAKQKNHERQVITHLIILSSPPLTPVFSSYHTTLLIVPSCDRPPPSDRTSGSASGFPMSNIRTFFSCPPVSRCDGEIATLRTM